MYLIFNFIEKALSVVNDEVSLRRALIEQASIHHVLLNILCIYDYTILYVLSPLYVVHNRYGHGFRGHFITKWLWVLSHCLAFWADIFYYNLRLTTALWMELVIGNCIEAFCVCICIYTHIHMHTTLLNKIGGRKISYKHVLLTSKTNKGW